MAVKSILGGWGHPKSPYGAFAGKDPAAASPRTPIGQLSLMSGWGHPKSAYGSFAGKDPAAVSVTPPFRGLLRGTGRMIH